MMHRQHRRPSQFVNSVAKKHRKLLRQQLLRPSGTGHFCFGMALPETASDRLATLRRHFADVSTSEQSSVSREPTKARSGERL